MFCLGCNNQLDFSNEQRALYKMYKPNDSIFFQSSTGDFDTLLILGIDSSESHGGILSGGPEKGIRVFISHLPVDHWITSYNCCPSQAIPNDLIVVGKAENQPDYYGIQYRGFRGELDFVNPISKKLIIHNKVISKYWNALTEMPTKHQKTEDVEEVIWTYQYGLTKYKKSNGDWYTVCNNP